MGKIRWCQTESSHVELKSLQTIQNKLVRFLNNKQIKDKISTKNLLNNINFLSVNQINVQIIITKVWKFQNLTQYPVNFNKAIIYNSREGLRSGASGKLIMAAEAVQAASCLIVEKD